MSLPQEQQVLYANKIAVCTQFLGLLGQANVAMVTRIQVVCLCKCSLDE